VRTVERGHLPLSPAIYIVSQQTNIQVASGYRADRAFRKFGTVNGNRADAMAAFAKSWRREWAMEKLTTKLSAQDRVILFCVATGIVHGSVGMSFRIGA
jgi:hypothetical protein